MDLGIAGRNAIICGSSQGLGRACAEALAAEGVNVVINGRDQAKLDKAAKEIAATAKGTVKGVAGDITTEAGRAALIASCEKPDILVNNNQGPEPGSFDKYGEDAWMKALEGNMVAPLMLIRAVLPGMVERRFGRIINVTSAMVTMPRSTQALSSGARAGLTAVVKGISADVAQHNVTINNMLPFIFDTPRQQQMAQIRMKRDNLSHDEVRRQQAAGVTAKRMGDPKEFGAMCAFLCSAYAGYFSGQNVRLDGGSYPGLV